MQNSSHLFTKNSAHHHVQRGFLLTRSARDIGSKIRITLWLKTDEGAAELIIDDEQVLFFIETVQIEQAKAVFIQHNLALPSIKSLTLKAFNQQAVSAVYFSTLREFYRARDLLKQQGIKCYEDDFRPEERFLMERFITADVFFSGARTVQNTGDYQRLENVKCKQAEQISAKNIKLKSVSLDIECSFKGKLYSIGLYNETCRQVLMIANKEQQIVEQKKSYDLDIIWLEDEQALLKALLFWFNKHDPDVVIGWNVINFDFHVLQKRYDHYGIEFSIGRDHQPPYWRQNKNSEQRYLEINGRVVLDGIDLLKTATYSFPSFALDYVANVLLGRGKKVDDVDNRLQEITDNFNHNKVALAEYNLEDCRLVALIFEHTQLLDFAVLRAQLTGLAIDRVGGSAAAFTNLYLPKLHRSGYIAPNMGDGDQGFESPGGYVMDSTPGLYSNVLVLDFKSLYPSIIRSFKIDPMGLIEGMKSPATAIPGFDGAFFSRDEHFLPDIIKNLWQERDKAKHEKNSALSQAIKIIMNSFYGVLGSTGCRFFDPRLSGSITKRSHAIMKLTKQWIEKKGYHVIYGDTDSIFVHAGDEQDNANSKKLGIVLQDFINEQWRKDLKQQFDIESELEIEFETHFSKFLMPTVRGQDVGTKKRYAGLVIKDGKQSLVFKGLESVRTDWTELAKEFQGRLYQMVFNDESVTSYIKTIVEETLAGKHDKKLIYRKRLRRKLSQYVKNIPPHVRAARAADELNKKQGKPLKFQNKGWIEYVITINGPQAKTYQTAPLDYQFYIDRQLHAVADAILPFINTSFIEITDNQMNLFD